MSELVLYIIIGVIWAIISLIQKANKKNKENTKSKSKNTVKNNNKKTYTNKKVNSNEEEIFRELKKNMESLKNYSEDTLRKNTEHQKVYTSNYETSNNDREMLELQQRYNSKISQINKECNIWRWVPEHLENVKKDHCFVISYWQCCDKPAYQIIDVDINGRLYLSGCGSWNGYYGGWVPIDGSNLRYVHDPEELFVDPRYKQRLKEGW